MISILLFPGEMVCNMVGLPHESDHRVIFRMFVNTLVYGVVGSVAVLAVML